MKEPVMKKCSPLYVFCTYSALGLNGSNVRISFALSTDI
jgi:hypothetical protein